MPGGNLFTGISDAAKKPDVNPAANPAAAGPVPAPQTFPAPAATPPAPPALTKTGTGPPVPALTKLHYWGSIQDFNKRVQDLHDQHLAYNGVPAKPAWMLTQAVRPGAVTDTAQTGFAPEHVVSDQEFLASLAQAAKTGDYAGWVALNGPRLTEMRRGPDGAQATAALTQAMNTDRAYKADHPGGGFLDKLGDTVGKVAATGLDVATLGTSSALGASSGYLPSSARVAKDLARAPGQIVTGLVYSVPAFGLLLAKFGKGVAATGYNVSGSKLASEWEHFAELNPGVALADLTVRLATGSGIGKENIPGVGFWDDLRRDQHKDPLVKTAVETAQGMYESFKRDLTDPEHNIGNLILDVLAFSSAGTGAALRGGRFVEEVRTAEGTAKERFGAGLEAAGASHPLKTFTLEKEGLAEQVKLAQNPFMRLAQTYLPYIGYQARQGRLDRTAAREAAARDAAQAAGEPLPGTLLPFGETITDGSGFLRWAHNLFTTEGIIGRAHDVRVTTEMHALTGIGGTLNQFHGSAIRRGVLAKLVGRDRTKGLTPGERYAVELLSLDPENGLSAVEQEITNRQHLISTGFGDAKNHEKAIANAELAKTALENPSPRLAGIIEAVTKVQAQIETIKHGLGLTEDTAEGRLAKMQWIHKNTPEYAAQVSAEDAVKDWGRKVKQNPGDESAKADLANAKADLEAKTVLRTTEDGAIEHRVGDTWVPVESAAPGSWYFRHQPKAKAMPRTGNWTRRLSPSGWLSPGTVPPELRHEMTGRAYLHGGYSTDITGLYGVGLARAARAFTRYAEYQRAYENGVDHYKPGYIFVRDPGELDPTIRQLHTSFVDDTLDKHAADTIPEELYDAYFPKIVTDEMNGKWVDPGSLGELGRPPLQPGAASRLFSKVNDVFRVPIFFAQPKYSMNGVGNAGMLVLDQGPFRAYVNFVQAMRLEDTALADDATLIKAHVGHGRAESYVSDLAAKWNKPWADFWSALTDEKFRVAAWIHYARMKGYAGPEGWHQLLHDSPEDLVDVTARANDSLVNFDKMSGWERARLRHLIFVYPWQRGAFMWSFRTIMEHPGKTALLAHLGEDQYKDEKWLQDASAWVRRTGYMPLNWAASQIGMKPLAKKLLNGEDPHMPVYNPTSINTWATLGDAYQTARAAVEGDQYASVGDLVGPPGQFLLHAVSGRDNFGNPYKGNQLWGAVMDDLGIVPLLAAIKRQQRDTGPPLKPIDITSLGSLQTRFNSAVHDKVMDPGWLDGFGSVIYGSQNDASLPAIAARWLRDEASPAQKHQLSVLFQNMMLVAQGEYLDRKVPEKVQAALTDSQQLSWRFQQWAAGHQKEALTTVERSNLALDYYRRAGRLSGSAVKQWRDKIDAAPKWDQSSLLAAIQVKYGGRHELFGWLSDVRRTAGVARQFDERVQQLHGLGLSSQAAYTATEADRLTYARAYTNYLDERNDLGRQLGNAPDRRVQLAIFDEQHAQPFKLGDRQLPALSALRLTDRPSGGQMTTQEVQAHLVAAFDSGWKNVPLTEKHALGIQTKPGLAVAWGIYDATVRNERANGRSVAANQKADLAKKLNRQYPGFTTDWLYATASKAERFERTTLYQALPDRDVMGQIVAQAKTLAGYVREKRNTASEVRRAWNAYVAKVTPMLPATLRQALVAYPTNFLESLVSHGG